MMRFLPTVVCTLSFVATLPINAQIALDGTVGPAVALSGPNYRITEDMGSARGSNLFHSFDRFNINAGEQATFTGSSGYTNVISRVTGKLSGGPTPSQIDGVLKSEVPNANFWLLNPAGVHFGPNARVNVPAALHVSTADHLRLADGSLYSAVEPEGSTLTAAPPEAFGFLPERARAAVVVKGASLNPSASDERKNVSLVGDDIIVDGGKIFANRGVIRLIAARKGEVRLTATGADFDALTASGSIELKDARIEAAGNGGGRVFIRGGALEMTNAMIDASNWGERSRQYEHSIDIGLNGRFTMSQEAKLESLADPGDAGGVRITASEVMLSGASGIVTNSQSTGAGGGINITADHVTVEGKSTLSASTKGSGLAGSITVNAVGQVNVTASGIVTKPSTASATGRGGDIRIDAGEIRLADGGSIVSGFDGEESAQARTTIGRAGTILLKASRKPKPNGTLTTGEIVVGKGAEISAQAYAEQGGGITFRAADLTFEEATVSVSTYGRADGSEIRLEADNIRLLAGTDIAARSNDSGSGGTIWITAADTFAMSDANVDVSPYSIGAGGSITITAPVLDVQEQSNISTGVDRTWRSSPTRASGDAGNIRLEASEALTIHDSVVGADVFEGQGGTITLLARDVRVDNSGVVTSVWGSGEGGNIRIDAERFEVANGGQGIFALTDDAGPGGTITVNASDSLAVAAGANISVQTTSAGSAGAIHIRAGSMTMTEGSVVSAEAFVPKDDNDPASPARLGPPGSIRIKIDDTFVIDGSDVITTTRNAAGPPVIISTAKLDVVNGGLIDASTFGPTKGGDISINTGALVVEGSARRPASEGASQPSSIIAKTFHSGAGGNITIDAADITLTAGGEIATSSADVGNAGTISLRNARRLVLDGGSITTEALEADGGQIKIQVDELIHMEGGQITTTVAGGVGDAGNIFIDPTFLVMENSRIEAKALGGNGGNISIRADYIIRDPASVIDATSRLGLSGAITLGGPEADLAGTVAVPAPDFLDASSLLAETCPGRSGQPRSGLVQGGRGGQPADPSRPHHTSVIADKLPETSVHSSKERRMEDAWVWPVPGVDLTAIACIEMGFQAFDKGP